jgi:chromosome partitioning protein
MIISCLTLKGGGGKTTIAVNLAAAFAQTKRVLIIDTDEQHSASSWAGERPETQSKITVVAIPEAQQLRKQIANFEEYDIILIDGTPAVGRMATVSAAISDLVIFPVCPSMFDIWATSSIMERVEEVKEIAPDIKTAIVANKIVRRAKQTEKLMEALAETNEHYVFNTALGYRVAYSDSIAEGLTALEWTDAKAKNEIQDLFAEINQLMEG